ncbi:MAG: glycosyltransferase family 2 protein [Myxococcota bacterium]
MKLSVVIPTLGESSDITGAIESAAAPGVEIVVVDGGSRDGTVELARAAGARVEPSERGRAGQLQVGVEATHGDVVVFLHADTRLPAHWGAAIEHALERRDRAGGAFRFHFAAAVGQPGGEGRCSASSLADRAALSIVEWGARLRTACFALPYGDQAIFVRRSVLEAIGGVPRVPIMEDLDLVKAMKSQGGLVILTIPVTTSPRRYLVRGVFRTMFRHWLAAAAWTMGVDRERLAAWYGR